MRRGSNRCDECVFPHRHSAKDMAACKSETNKYLSMPATRSSDGTNLMPMRFPVPACACCVAEHRGVISLSTANLHT